MSKRRSLGLLVAVLLAVPLAALGAGAAASAPAPTVTGLSPASGRPSGGNRVTVGGTGFVAGASVSFGGTAGTSVSVVSANALTVVAPPHAVGQVDVHVTTASGTSSTTDDDGYTYAAVPSVTGVSPASGTPAIQNTVTVSGYGFVPGARVLFGDVPVSGYPFDYGYVGGVLYVSPKQLKVRVPPHAAGSVDVRVTTPSGISPATAADHYTYGPDGTGVLSVIAGRCTFVTPGPARRECLEPTAVAVDSHGNRYLADSKNQRVEKITPDGTLSIVAGSGGFGTPTPGPATASRLGYLDGLAVDPAGNVYIADGLGCVVEKVTPDGVLSVVAGTGTCNFMTPGPAVLSPLDGLYGIAVDGAGNLYLGNAFQVTKVTPDGLLSIVAGTGNSGSPTPGPATQSDLGEVGGVALDATGDIYLSDSKNHLLEKVTPGGTLSIAAGTGTSGPPTPGPATSSNLMSPNGVAVDPAGNLYIADQYSDVVAKVTSGGTLSIVAGTGNAGRAVPGPATSSGLDGPTDVAADAAGTVYVTDENNFQLQKVTAGGTLTILAGVYYMGPPIPGPATRSGLGTPRDLVVAPDGTSYVLVATTSGARVITVSPAGTLSFFAGTGNSGPPTPGPARKSALQQPQALALDAQGNLYIANAIAKDDGFVTGGQVLKVTPGGTLSIYAQTDDPIAGLALDSAGDLYFSDYWAEQVVKIAPDGTSSVVAGNGRGGAPKPGPALDSPLDSPVAVAVDPAGNVYIANTYSGVIAKVTPGGTLSVVVDDGNTYNVAVDATGDLYFVVASYYDTATVYRLSRSGERTALVGDGFPGAPTPGPATSSALRQGVGLAIGPAGDLYLVDASNYDLEKVTFPAAQSARIGR